MVSSKPGFIIEIAISLLMVKQKISFFPARPAHRFPLKPLFTAHFEFFPGNFIEADPVTWFKNCRNRGRRVKKGYRRSAYDLPSARTAHGIDSGLTTGYAYTTWSNLHWDWLPGDNEFVVDLCHIGKSRQEPNHVYIIFI